MKKVFASDFDGTLYFYKADVKLPPESVEKINEYQKAGHKFGLCTGRQIGGLTPFITGFFDPDFTITSTGANICGPNYQGIVQKSIDFDIAEAVAEEYHAKGHKVSIDIDGVINVYEEMDYPGEYNVISNMATAPKGMVFGIGIHCETLEEAASIAKSINDRFGDRINAFQNVIEVDLAPKGCSKGLAISEIRKYYGDCRIYGIGDSINDLPLIEAADVSYTFPYAPPEVQEKATKIVDTIVEALEDSMQDPIDE